MTESPAQITALPLFPLQSVLFPGGLLGLKVFETRYLDLVARCLREDTPFGVVCLRQGDEVQAAHAPVRLEAVGTLARLTDVDAEQTGILRVHCVGGRRFRTAAPHQSDDGLWLADATLIDADPLRAPLPTLVPTVLALRNAIQSLRAKGQAPFVEPYQWADAGWVANRWCELLPIPLAARQRLMELQDPIVRLQLVQDYLRGKGVVGPG